MKMMIVAGIVITLPAILIALLNIGKPLMIPALASLFVNSIPFVVAGLLIKKQGGDDDDVAGH